jgi:hypothetical protein
MLPGSVIAYLAVSTFCLDGRFARLAFRIFVILSLWDILIGFWCPNAFRDTLFSVSCDALGAPIGALLLVSARRLFFSRRDSGSNFKPGPQPGAGEKSIPQ